MTTPAQKIQQKIKDPCEAEGWFYCKHISQTVRGYPDISIIVNGDTYYFEVKSDNDKLSDKQKFVHEQMNGTKKICHVVKSYEQFQELVKDFPKQVKKKLTNIINPFKILDEDAGLHHDRKQKEGEKNENNN